MKTFEQWLPSFLAFRTSCRTLLGQSLPSEVPQLNREEQELQPMFHSAQDFAADAIAFYYQDKNVKMDNLLEQGFPKSSLDSAAKAQSYKTLWAKEQAERLAEVIDSRSYKVSAALSRLKP